MKKVFKFFKSVKGYISLWAVFWLIVLPMILIFCLGLPKWLGHIISIAWLYVGLFLLSFVLPLMPGTDYNDPAEVKKHKLTRWQEFMRVYFYVVPWEKDEKKKKRNRVLAIFGGGARILLLAFCIFWSKYLFAPFLKDIFPIIEQKPYIEKIQGKIIEHDSVYGTVPIYQSFQLDGMKDANGDNTWFYYYYGFTYLRINSNYSFIVLKNSNIVLDDEKIN